jgi:histidine triad (HIT) family protein
VDLHDPDEMTRDCVFCKIGRGEIPATVVYRDDDLVAIEDLNPQAPVHLLVLPLRHYQTVAEAAQADAALCGRLVAAAAALGTQRGPNGFRLVVNSGPDGGQTVGHVHVHVLAGRALGWPPG